MTTPAAPAPMIKAEIVSAPAISNMNVTQVGNGMFSIKLDVVLAVRFPGLGEVDNNTASDLHISTVTPSSTSELMYGNGSSPDAGNETVAFNDFVGINGYPPPSQEVLMTWVQNNQ